MIEEADPFKYIVPDPALHDNFENVASSIAMAYRMILSNCPQSRERSLAITKLQESRMWANAAISFDGKKIEQ